MAVIDPTAPDDHWRDLIRDLVDDVRIGISRHLARSVGRATVAAMAVGLLAAAAVWSASSAGAVSGSFDALRADAITVALHPAESSYGFHPETIDGIASVPGVRGSAAVEPDQRVVWLHPESPWRTSKVEVSTLAVVGDPGALGIEVDAAHGGQLGPDEVAIGAALAAQHQLDHGDRVLIDGSEATVGAIIRRADRYPDALVSIVDVWPVSAPQHAVSQDVTVVVHIQSGRAAALAPVVVNLLDPIDPSSLFPSYQPEATTLERSIQNQVDQLITLISAAILLVGAMIELVLSWMAVRAHAKLLALRLALGESRLRLVAPSIAEAGVISLLGGATGWALGTAVGAGMATRADMVVIWSAPIVPLGFAVAVAAAVTATTVAALQVARLDPVATLRAA